LWAKEISWIYRFGATACCGILSSALVEDGVTLGSDPSATKAAYSMWTITSLLLSIYDYAGACNAINPVLSEEFLATIAIAPSLPVSEEYKIFLQRIHISDIPRLWDDTEYFKENGHVGTKSVNCDIFLRFFLAKELCFV
jgi:hypothetical protein